MGGIVTGNSRREQFRDNDLLGHYESLCIDWLPGWSLGSVNAMGGAVAYCKLVAFACVFVVIPPLKFSSTDNTLKANVLRLPVIQLV